MPAVLYSRPPYLGSVDRMPRRQFRYPKNGYMLRLYDTLTRAPELKYGGRKWNTGLLV